MIHTPIAVQFTYLYLYLLLCTIAQIYDLETTYLEETKDLGNIFTGWENYISKEKVKVRKTIANEERLFSLSSVTSPASRREDSKAAQREKSVGKPEKEKKTGGKKKRSGEEAGIDDDRNES